MSTVIKADVTNTTELPRNRGGRRWERGLTENAEITPEQLKALREDKHFKVKVHGERVIDTRTFYGGGYELARTVLADTGLTDPHAIELIARGFADALAGRSPAHEPDHGLELLRKVKGDPSGSPGPTAPEPVPATSPSPSPVPVSPAALEGAEETEEASGEEGDEAEETEDEAPTRKPAAKKGGKKKGR